MGRKEGTSEREYQEGMGKGQGRVRRSTEEGALGEVSEEYEVYLRMREKSESRRDVGSEYHGGRIQVLIE